MDLEKIAAQVAQGIMSNDNDATEHDLKSDPASLIKNLTGIEINEDQIQGAVSTITNLIAQKTGANQNANAQATKDNEDEGILDNVLDSAKDLLGNKETQEAIGNALEGIAGNLFKHEK